MQRYTKQFETRSSPHFSHAFALSVLCRFYPIRKKVVVERCGAEWWAAAERKSEIWSDDKARWGQYLWSDVIARQVALFAFLCTSIVCRIALKY